MSDQIKHECGIAMLRLLKPIEYYQEKYGTILYGINKMYLLMEKQHNRGQDGVGLVSVKFDTIPGESYIDLQKSVENSPIQDCFAKITKKYEDHFHKNSELLKNPDWVRKNIPFCGNLFMGHLRYGTYGGNTIANCHPFLLESNWKSRVLAIAGNFNMTNVDEQFDFLVNELGMSPIEKKDTVTILEKLGHFLSVENERLFLDSKNKGLKNKEISNVVERDFDIQKMLKGASYNWDGGYMIGGVLGHGDAFAFRDPAGIRPGFYYKDDEVVVIASERPVIQTAFNVTFDKVKEIEPGQAVIIKKSGEIKIEKIRSPREKKSCSFERIYFSRGSDVDIYKERKELGKLLYPAILESINYDLVNSVFSFIPNTAQVAFYGLVEGLRSYSVKERKEQILALKDKVTPEALDLIFSSTNPRFEKVAIKDAKLRTFITQDSDRDDLVAHVYDATYGVVKRGQDNLVILDDSIVRGTTLKKSILRILDRLGPKKIVVVSSAPQIRYPDCYGIDMAKLGDFVAFQAAISLLKENNMENVIEEVYKKCKAQVNLPDSEIVNYVKEIYSPFKTKQISAKIAELVKPDNCKAEIEVIFQTIEDLHMAIPNHKGDWYFTGNYPTLGGFRVVNKSFINFYEGRNERAY